MNQSNQHHSLEEDLESLKSLKRQRAWKPLTTEGEKAIARHGINEHELVCLTLEGYIQRRLPDNADDLIRRHLQDGNHKTTELSVYQIAAEIRRGNFDNAHTLTVQHHKFYALDTRLMNWLAKIYKGTGKPELAYCLLNNILVSDPKHRDIEHIHIGIARLAFNVDDAKSVADPQSYRMAMAQLDKTADTGNVRTVRAQMMIAHGFAVQNNTLAFDGSVILENLLRSPLETEATAPILAQYWLTRNVPPRAEQALAGHAERFPKCAARQPIELAIARSQAAPVVTGGEERVNHRSYRPRTDHQPVGATTPLRNSHGQKKVGVAKP